MIKLLTILWGIMLKKSSPQDLPKSGFFLGLMFFFYFFSQIYSGISIALSIEDFLKSFFIDAVLLSICLRLILQFSGTLSFFKQSLSALFGTGTIFNIIATPIIIIISNSMMDAASINELEIPAPVSIALLAIAIWSIIVMAHIFSRVISNPSFAMTAAFSYAVINFIVQSSIASL